MVTVYCFHAQYQRPCVLGPKWLLTGHHHKCTSPLDEKPLTVAPHWHGFTPRNKVYVPYKWLSVLKPLLINRIKAISWLFMGCLFFSSIRLFTSMVYQKAGKREGTTAQNKEIKSNVFKGFVVWRNHDRVCSQKVTKSRVSAYCFTFCVFIIQKSAIVTILYMYQQPNRGAGGC